MSHPAPSPAVPDPVVTTETTDHDHPHHERYGHGRRWWVLAVLSLTQLMVVLDATIVNIALPSAQRDLGFSDADRQWVVTSYSLAFGGLLLLFGRLSDLVGRRTTLLIGLVGFAGASALGGASHTFAVLVLARTLQGVFGAVLAPTALSILTTTFTDPGERGRAFAVFGAIAGGGAALGLLLGGVLTQYLSWAWCLYVNVPLSLLAMAGTVALIRQSRSADRPHLDVPGTVLVVAGLVSLVYGFSRADTDGWTDTLTLVMLAASVVLLTAFVALQARVSQPLLPLRVVTDRRRGGAYVALTLTSVGTFAVFLFLTYYLQSILHYSPLRSGFAFLPLVGGLVLASAGIVTRALPRVGPRVLVVAGEFVAAAGLVMMATLTTSSGYTVHVMPALVVVGLGLGLIFGSAFNAATVGVEARDAGVASALTNTGQQVGGAVGTALLNTIASQITTAHLPEGRPGAADLAAASVAGFSGAFGVAAAVLAVTGIVVGLLMPGGRIPADAHVTQVVPH